MADVSEGQMPEAAGGAHGGPGDSGGPAPVRRGHSLRVGRLLGVPVRVHWTFALLLVFVLLVDRGAGWRVALGGLVWVVALYGFVLEHELAHCVVARRRGAEVRGILLIPLGGLSQLARIPDRPADELAIAGIGPLVSLTTGVVLLGAGVVAGASVWPPTLFAGSWWARLGWVNLLLGAFNLLPALPMDGGRILRALLARRWSRLDATLIAGRIARGVALAMVVAGLWYDVWLLLIGIFVYVGATAEERAARQFHAGGGQGGPPGSTRP